MKIAIIGSGNVATHISTALQQAGNEIMCVYSKTKENATALADSLGCNVATSLEEISKDADLYLFSVKDDALKDLAESIAKTNEGKGIFVHTAGSVPMEIFNGLTERYGVLYPMQTFSKTRNVDFKKVPCFIEASDEETERQITALAEGITEKVQRCSSEKRKRIHLAAVFACNFTNHCYRLAERVVEKEGLDFELFLPLIEETARKVTEMSPRKAQTGPMVRWDVEVMNRQLDLIDDERTKMIYRLMAESIHREK